MQSQPLSRPPTTCRILLLIGITLLICYSNTFQSSWQLDDKPNILRNDRIHLTELNSSQLWQASHAGGNAGLFRRPVAYTSLAFNWFFGQKNVLGYHLVNILIHCCTAWFLFLTIKTLFSTPQIKNRYTPKQIVFISALATLLWALNPIHTQAVTYIVQRMTSMAGMFSILTILFYLQSRLQTNSLKRIWLLLCSTFSYVFAIFSKENAGAIILTLPVFELLFFHITLSKQIIKRIFSGLVVGSIIAILVGTIVRPELFDFILNYYSNRPFTLIERLLTEQRIILHYLSQIFFPAPWRLSIEHDTILSTSIIIPWTTLAAIVTNWLIVFIALILARKHPFFSLAILFYYINHLVESTIVPLELIFEHRNYLPSFFIFLPIATLVQKIIASSQHNKFISIPIIVAMSILLAAEGYATYERNKVWNTKESLWLDAVSKAPNSARPLATLALKLGWGPNPSERKYRKALEMTKRTLTMRMSRRRLDASQISNMASLHNELGEYQNAIFYYKQALKLAPEDANIRFNLCKTLVNTGNFIRAEEEIVTILDQQYAHADYLNLLGFIRIWGGQPEQALQPLQEALQKAPGRPDILLTLGKCFSLLGYNKKANWYFSQARKNGGNDAIVSLCIIENSLRGGAILQAQRELQQSIKQFSIVYFLTPLHTDGELRYRSLPLARDILLPFIRAELPLVTNSMLQ